MPSTDNPSASGSDGDQNAVRSEWDVYGAPCAGSRWFAATPNVEMDASRRVVWRCPIANCGGEMKFTGEVWPTGDPGRHHKCNKCGFTAAIKGAVFGVSNW